MSGFRELKADERVLKVYVFSVWFSQQTATVFLNNINRLDFVMENNM
jgi:hypothetical protein